MSRVSRVSRVLLGGLLWVVLAGCGGQAAPAPVPMPAPVETSYRPPPPCRTADDCAVKGIAALETGRGEGRGLLTLACSKGSVDGCFALGVAQATGRAGAEDRAAAREAFSRICRDPGGQTCSAAGSGSTVASDTCVVDACAWLAALAPSDDAGRVTLAKRGCSLQSKRPETRALRSQACAIVAADCDARQQVAAAREAHTLACALGATASCGIATKPRPVASHEPGEGTLEMPSATTDGLTMRAISCKIQGSSPLGILGGMTVGAGFAQRKAALAACSPHPFDAKIRWTAENLHVTEITAETGDSKVNACVEKALRGALSVATAHCSAIVVVGPP